MTNIFPLNYSTKTTPDGTDVVWSSDAVTNFNLTISSIALYTLTNATTDDLYEWSVNKYYTTARVEADTIWKADKNNVLELDNTTPYTPTLDYHPVTKDYVDNMSIPYASETQAWVVEKATITETMNWTANKYPDASSIRSVYTPRSYTAPISLTGGWNGSFSITHSLWVIPSSVTIYILNTTTDTEWIRPIWFASSILWGSITNSGVKLGTTWNIDSTISNWFYQVITDDSPLETYYFSVTWLHTTSITISRRLTGTNPSDAPTIDALIQINY